VHAARGYWRFLGTGTARFFSSIDRPVASDIRSGYQILVGLRGAAKVAVMASMSTKSREVIYGGRIISAKICADGAREAAAMV
jgi:hypothetical protein